MRLGFLGWIVAILVFSACMAFSADYSLTYPTVSLVGRYGAAPMPAGERTFAYPGTIEVKARALNIPNNGVITVFYRSKRIVNGVVPGSWSAWSSGSVLGTTSTFSQNFVEYVGADVPANANAGVYESVNTKSFSLVVQFATARTGPEFPDGFWYKTVEYNVPSMPATYWTTGGPGPSVGAFSVTVPTVVFDFEESTTPTPTPTPTPTTGEGEITLENADSATVGLYVDLDGDGVLERVAGFEAEGGNFDFTVDPAWYGKDYGLHVESLTIDGKKVPYSKTLQTGTFSEGSNVSAGGSVQVEVQPGVGTISVGPNGGAPQLGQVQVNTVTSGGSTQTAYTYQNATGGQTSVVYNDPGADPVKASDLRQASAQASADAEKIVAAIKEGPSVTTQSGPTWEGEPDQPAPLDTTQGDSALSKAGQLADEAGAIGSALKTAVPAPPAIESDYGQTLTWSVTFPLIGVCTFDLTPYSDLISAWRAFLKFVLGVLCWITSVRVLKGAFV